MPQFTRVRLNESGHEVSVQNIRPGMTPIEEPAVDRAGRPLPPRFAVELRGKELDDALRAAGLKLSGSADEKRDRLADHRAQTTGAAGAGDATPTGGVPASSEEDSK